MENEEIVDFQHCVFGKKLF